MLFGNILDTFTVTHPIATNVCLFYVNWCKLVGRSHVFDHSPIPLPPFSVIMKSLFVEREKINIVPQRKPPCRTALSEVSFSFRVTLHPPSRGWSVCNLLPGCTVCHHWLNKMSVQIWLRTSPQTYFHLTANTTSSELAGYTY